MSQIANPELGSAPVGSPTLYNADISFSIPDNGQFFLGGTTRNGSTDFDKRMVTQGSGGADFLSFRLFGSNATAIFTNTTTPDSLIVLSMDNTPVVRYFYGIVFAYTNDFSAADGAGFRFSAAAIGNGVSARLIGSSIESQFIDSNLTGISVSFATSFGIFTNVFAVIVQGLAGVPIEWGIEIDSRVVF